MNIDAILTKSTLSNFDIKKLADYFNIKFNGVLMNDQLKKEYFKQDFFIILNFEDTFQNGSHWVALVNDAKSKTCYYMDSYGELPNQKVYDVIIKTGHNLYFNKVQYQAIESQMCGWFSLYFLLMMQKPSITNMNKFLSKFNTKNYIANDKIIKDIYKSLNKKVIKNNFSL